MAIELPDELIALETTAWEQIQAGTLDVPTAHAVHQAVGEYAEAAGIGRYEVEVGLKQIVRHSAAG